MRTEGNKKRSKLEHYMLTPIIRILSRARDFYMKSMEDCVGKMHGVVELRLAIVLHSRPMANI
ncbi:hypothetical protein TIFTF001_021535 [Ficus carica]|uniref:Uncharacterized protein n=1 Tax=Ficus carica TaxID=3494 RepID=A0AA88DBY7_FICCA|nr:hypothetical protein TIFTF001_021535 [Ficus carica]